MIIRFILSVYFVAVCGATKPNVVVIIADDLGWNDVGFHGMNQIPTPNIDALAYSGIILQNYYVTPLCTPSRAAFMTGKYPIHTGMQHSVLFAMETRGLPLSEKILPQYLKELGYKTHLVGKWHLGFYKKEYLPMNRGYDSHIGFWSGRIDHFDHTSMENGTWGFDFRRGFEVAHDLFGKYVTDIYSEEAVKVIRAHDTEHPLFLTVAHSAVHSGNPYEPIRAPDKVVANFSYIKDDQRRKFAGVLAKLDESVGMVTAALQEKGILENTIILFTTDNGGPAEGFNDNAASNYPLRGVKNTLWEGGVRGAALLWSPLINKSSRVALQRMHIVDWLPTLVGAVGGNTSEFSNLDGVNQWDVLSQDLPSIRHSLVHIIDDVFGHASITIGPWKVINGSTYKGKWDKWFGPSGRDGLYDVDLLYRAPAGVALTSIGKMPNKDDVTSLRQQATVHCNETATKIPCFPLQAPCLFNIDEDPCELTNLADENPEMLQNMLKEMQKVNETAVPPNNTPLDHHGDPKYWGRVYTTFGDFERSNCL